MNDKKDKTQEGEVRLNPTKVKRIIKETCDDPNVRISGSGLQFLTDVATEFISIISLAALDKSSRPKQYIDSAGVLKALRDLGFGDIADELPDLSSFTEDMLAE